MAAARQPHDAGHLLWRDGEPVQRLIDSMDRWIGCLLAEDGIEDAIEAEHDVALMARTDGAIPSARVVARQEGIIAGIAVIERMIATWFPDLSCLAAVQDGDHISADDVVLMLQGAQNQMLCAERTVLNILGRLSGLCTHANELTRRTNKEIAATRKTTWGVLDKWAVHLGGALTHRLDRNEAMMIKENDAANAAPGADSIERLRITLDARRFEAIAHSDPKVIWGRFLCIEVRSKSEAIEVGKWLDNHKEEDMPDVIMLIDNLGPKGTQNVVDALRSGKLCEHVVIEASGGIRPENVADWNDVDVDVISMSTLTQGVNAFDLSMLIDEVSEGV